MTSESAQRLLTVAKACHHALETLCGEAVMQAGGGLPGYLSARAQMGEMFELKDQVQAAINEAEA